MTNALQAYYQNNQDEIQSSFNQHISDIEDCYEFIKYAATDEGYFWEFVENFREKDGIRGHQSKFEEMLELGEVI